MAHRPCLILSLCATHALGSVASSFHAIPRGDHDRPRQRDKKMGQGSWSLDTSRFLSRARGSPQSFNYAGIDAENMSREASQRPGSWVYGRRGVGTGPGEFEVALRIARYRAGSSGGYNYDDDYYGGQPAEDPYYEDGGGWRDESGGRSRGRGDRYDPQNDRRGSGRRKDGSVGGFDLTGTITQGNKMYGIYALAGSLLLTMMGISLMFEKNLIRLGNMGFLVGIALFIGPSNIVRYFTQTSRLRGTIIFALGFFFVFTGHPIIGLAIEIFGFLNLFGNMLPVLWAMARNMPFVKDIIGSGGSQREGSGRRGAKRPTKPPPPRRRENRYGYEEDEWDNNGGDWGYDDYDYDPYRR